MSLDVTRYARARTLDEAVELLRTHGEAARILAGGTDLLGTLKDRIHGTDAAGAVLIDIKSIDGLTGVCRTDEGWVIGALTRLSDLERHPELAARFPALVQAAGEVAAPQLRNMGTLAGNLCQEPRCWYYRNYDDLFHCMRKGGTFCDAQWGENRYHSIYGAARVGSAPCTLECPTGSHSPAYFARVREGDLSGAAEILLGTNPLGAVTGRVCPRYCEQGCNRAEVDQAVSIRSLERHVGDYALENAATLAPPPAVQAGRSVAVIGAGPTGLTAAFYLRRRGYRVVVVDRMEEAGGMLRYSIPAFRLPPAVVRSEIDMLASMGVEFRLGVEVGRDVSLADLRRQHDAVLVACGTWKSRSLGLAGEEHLVSGLDFLAAVARGGWEAPGDRVLVVGGGDVAVDVAVTARRLGAASVTMVCLEMRTEMPAIDADVEEALAEGVGLVTSYGPSRILVEGGRLRGVEFAGCTTVFDAAGRFAPAFDPVDTVIVDADTVILAIGQAPDLTLLADVPELVGERGLLRVLDASGATALDGVFAAGDATSGPSTVVKAIASARRAADSIDLYLGGRGGLSASFDGSSAAVAEGFATCALGCGGIAGRVPSTLAEVEHRTLDQEDVGPISSAGAVLESSRCANCGCVAVSPSDLAPALLALDGWVRTTKRDIPATGLFTARLRGSTVLDSDEIVREVVIPASAEGRRSAYLKFRIRQAIDFPVVCAAVSYRLDGGGVVRDARVALGAAAPVPLRLHRVERELEGQRLNEETAGAAARAVEDGISPLAANGYKVQIAKALVRRAILAAV